MVDEYEEQDDTISQEDIDNLVARANSAESKNIKLTQAIGSMESGGEKDKNFLHHQISTSEILKNLEHFYRGDFQDYDNNNELVWKTQTDTDLITFNAFGVSSMMEVLSKYIDKNTILSDYTEQRIYEILGDIGEDLILFILSNYEKMGMDTHFKKTKFRLIITTTTHIIESAYRRAIRGKTLTEINQSRVIGQFGNGSNHNQPIRIKKEGFMNKVFG